MSSPPLFAAEGVCKRFGEREVLNSASLWARAGVISAVFGRNGCGKSTLLKCATGLVAMDNGVVHFAGNSYLRPRLPSLARAGLYYLSDSAELPWTLSVRRAAGWIRERFGGGDVACAMSRLGLDSFQDARPYELSGGERKKAALALAVVRGPRVLLADEPFAGVAPLDAHLIAQSLRELAAAGSAVVVTGHEVTELFAIADEVTWLTAGTTHGLGTPAESRRHDQFAREYLGTWHSAAARATNQQPPGH